MQLADVNILVNAFRTEAPHHVVCHKLIDEQVNGESAYAVSDFVINGFIRVLSNGAIHQDPPDMRKILTFADQVRNQPHAIVVTPGKRHWEIFTRLCRQTDARRKLIPDAYLAALAIEHGCEFVTCDRDFARFEGLRWRSPLN
ncbi:type II toxin-antitoxin system VapC family toxin [Nonomuraea fastidiosa]|jgi:toxin-antitoxin system PIN domain toxin|uniref:type II toxin-antitoxin system VapC family toxin n=1 Tax=Nonomuraea TaxID=83681 RepID=UPI003445AE36